MSKCNEEHKVCDSHKRTMAIQATDKVFEILFDTFVLSAILTRLMPLEAAILDSVSVSLIIEGFCFAVGYLNLRLWNKFQWGRKVTNVATNRS